MPKIKLKLKSIMFKYYSAIRLISIQNKLIKNSKKNNDQERHKFNKLINLKKLLKKQVIVVTAAAKVQGQEETEMSGGVSNRDTMFQTYSEYRKWIHTRLGNKIFNESSNSVNNLQFTLVSYNILAQYLLQEYQYLYQNHDPEALQWEHRLQKLRDEIFFLNPDILCLQEVQEDHLLQIVDSLKGLNFNYIFKKKTDPSRSDGVAILYNKNLFNLISNHSVEYYKPNVYLLDRHNVGLIVKMNLINNPNVSFLIATTHLLYNPRRQDVRLAQLQVLLADIDRLAVCDYSRKYQEFNRIPIILTGDFNLQPNSSPYNLVAGGRLYYSNLTKHTLEIPQNTSSILNGKTLLTPALGITDNCQHIDIINKQCGGEKLLKNTENNSSANYLSDDLIARFPDKFSTGVLTHNLRLFSTYCHPVKNQDGSTYQNEWITVDYIFYNKLFNSKNDSYCEGNLKLLSRYVLPNQEQCKQMGMIPNKNLGSDHLALAVKFLLIFNKQSNL